MNEKARIAREIVKDEHAWLRNKFMWLFIFMLGVLIYYPYSAGSNERYYIFRTVFCAIILFSVYALSLRRTVVIFALLLAVPAVLQHTFFANGPWSSVGILNAVLSFSFDMFIVVVLFRRIFAEDHADSESIFGALCIYVFVGFSFGSLYSLIARVHPTAFYLDPSVNDHKVFDRIDSIYYSFATMTSVGAAGITPVSSQARSVTIIEAILGVLFLAVLISRLMGAYHPRTPSEKVAIDERVMISPATLEETEATRDK